jgi:hypothetical protein
MLAPTRTAPVGAAPIPRPELHAPGIAAIAVLVVLGLGALAGGVNLVLRPDGSGMGFHTSLLAGSPFTDFLLPGLILGGLFGIGSLVAALGGLRRAQWAPFLAFAIGTGQMVWIVVELAIIHEFSFLHPTMFALGLVIAAAAVPWGWPTFAAWRRARRPSFPTGPRPGLQAR